MRRSVLIIEDHPESSIALEQMLIRRGFIVESAKTMGEATSLIKFYRDQRRTPFDVIVSDLSLPDSDVDSTLSMLKAFAQSTPVRAITGSDDPQVVMNAKKLGVPLILKGTPAEGIMESILYALAGTNPDQETAEAILDNRSVVRELPNYRAATIFDRWPPFMRRIAIIGSAITVLATAVTTGAAVYHGLTNRVILTERDKQHDAQMDSEIKGTQSRVGKVERDVRAVQDSQIEIVQKLDSLGKKIDENKQDTTHQLDRIEQQRK